MRSLITIALLLWSCSLFMQCSATNCSTVWSARIISTSSKRSNIVIKTESCPGYDWTSESDPNPAVVQSTTLTFPATPNIQSQPFIYVGIYGADNKSAPYPSSGYVMGAIGVATNGVFIFGNANLDGSNAFEQEAYSFDTCGGHASPTGDQYHYHQQTAPGCLASFTNVAGQHSSIFGLMMDGVAIFGPLGDKGVVPTDLDQCQGHVDTTYPFYHYHLPYNWAFPYTTACLRGCVSKANWNNVPSSVICSSSSSQVYTSSDYSSVVGLFKAAAQVKTAQAPTIKFLTYVAEVTGINTTGFASGAPSSGSSGPPSGSSSSTTSGPPSKSSTSTSGGPPSKSPISTSRGPPSGSSSTAGGPPSKSPTSTSGGPPSGSSSTAGGPPSKSSTSKSRGPPSDSLSTVGGPTSKSPTSRSGGPPSGSSSTSSGGPPSSSSSTVNGGPPSDGAQPSGGATPSGGAQPSGGATPSGGAQPSGGATPSGGAQPSGGATPSGGAQPSGGATPSSGAQPSGGATPSGGAQPSGRAPPSGGAQPSGGTVPSGGAQPSGGTAPSGGAQASGGTVPSGGAQNGGGGPQNGGGGPQNGGGGPQGGRRLNLF